MDEKQKLNKPEEEGFFRMNFLEETTLSELDVIKLAIRHRRKGAKKLLETYMKLGKLQSNDSIKSLIKIMETLYESVRVEGGGTKRKYVLSGKKKRPTKKVTDYKGTVPTIDDEIVKEYIMSKLINLDSKYTDGSYKYWARVLGMPQETDMNTIHLEKIFAKKYSDKVDDDTPSFIVGQFNTDLTRRSKKYVETAFNHLKQEGRIKLTDTYYEVRRVAIKKNMKTSYIKGTTKITKVKFSEIQEWIYNECDSHGITKKQYTDLNLYPNMKAHASVRIAKKNIDSDLLTEYGIYGIFKGVKVKVLDDYSNLTVGYSKFKKAYYNKFLKNSITQQNNENYYDSPFESKAFYLYNSLLILKEFGVHELDDLVNEHKPTQEQMNKLYEMKMKYVADKVGESVLIDRQNMAF